MPLEGTVKCVSVFIFFKYFHPRFDYIFITLMDLEKKAVSLFNLILLGCDKHQGTGKW